MDIGNIFMIIAVCITALFIVIMLLAGIRDRVEEIPTIKKQKEKIAELNKKIEELSRENNELNRKRIFAENELQAYKRVNAQLEEKLPLLKQEKLYFSREFIDALGGRYSPEFIRKGIERGRLDNIFKLDTKALKLKSIDISAVIESNGEPRNVRLNSCNCKDFNAKKEGFACKHILYLTYILGILQQDPVGTQGLNESIRELKFDTISDD